MIVIVENITARYVTASEPFVGGLPPLTAFHGWLHRLIRDIQQQHQLHIRLHGFGVAHGQAWYHDDHPRFVNYQKRDKSKAADNASTVDRRRMDMELCLFLDIDVAQGESIERVKNFFSNTHVDKGFEKTLVMTTFKKGYIEPEARGRSMRVRVGDNMTQAIKEVSKLWKVLTPYELENPQEVNNQLDDAIDQAWLDHAFPTIIGGLHIHDYQTHAREWPAVAVEHLLGWIYTKTLGRACRDDSEYMYQPDTRTVLDEHGNEQQCFLLIPYACF